MGEKELTPEAIATMDLDAVTEALFCTKPFRCGAITPARAAVRPLLLARRQQLTSDDSSDAPPPPPRGQRSARRLRAG